MPLTPATRLGPYEITAKIGEGGMGEVYRARDTTLDRDVALKVLLDSFAHDPDRLARFEREAKLLASLNHPHIAQIYGLEVSGTTSALVMELVDGLTLADRIAQGPLPLDEALAIARQIADALAAAHDQGIVHRDLKPANIKLRSDGTVKVLDFGLAKFAEAASSSGPGGPGAMTISPTITSPAMTQVGIILGTAAYMSPEQARGRPVDRRADIWAFGVILFEMFVGSRPFSGDDITETLASIVKDQPDLHRVPHRVRRLLGRCLEKDPRRRLRDIGDAWDLLDDATTPAPIPTTPAPTRLRVVPWAIAGVFALIAAGLATAHFRGPAATPPAAVRFQISAAQQAGNATPAISPDGRHIVYQAGNRIFVRDLDAVAPRLLTTTESIVLLAGVAVDDDTVQFVAPDGLRQVSLQGGQSTLVLSIPFAARGTVPGARFGGIGSRLLPGHRIVYSKESETDGGAFVAPLDGSSKPARVLENGVRGVNYVPADATGKEYLLFTRAGTLMAQAFDSGRLQVSGEPAVIADKVSGFSVSNGGTIVYSEAGEGRRLVWVNRQGAPTGTAWAGEQFNELSLSPDGSKVAVVRAGGPSLWLYDFGRESSVQLTKLAGTSLKSAWSPDGSRVAYASNRGGGILDLYAAPVSGDGPDELLFKSPLLKYPLSWSRDGRWLLFTSLDPTTKEDLWVLPMSGSGERKPEPFLVTNYHETDASFSPDGHSVAYVSDESGTSEVYVRGFPSGPKRIVSNGGGYQPRWRSDGKELLYLSGRGQLLSAESRPGADFGSPRVLFQATIYGGGPSINNWYWDVAPGGDRMLFNAGSTESGTSLVTVVLNWQAGRQR
jgi:Tol biopolymer transport system component